jgi:hypothetical protein
VNSSEPKIIVADHEEFLTDLQKRLPGYVPGWLPEDPGFSLALMRIFARYLDIFAVGLNQVPDRSRMAFLDMLGIQLLPAQAARAPLVFTLTENAPVDVTLPRGSQVAATASLKPPSSSTSKREPASPVESTFATGQTITLSRSRIAALYSIDPRSDAFADHTAQRTDGFTLFDDLGPTEHAIYLGHNQLFAIDGEDVVVMLSFSIESEIAHPLKTQWEYLTDSGWSPLVSAPEDDTTDGMRRDGLIILRRDCAPKARQDTFEGHTSYWLRGLLTTPVLPDGPKGARTVPAVNDIRARVGFTRGGIPPEAAFADVVLLDISKEFYPFGQQAATYSTFYLACKEVFQRKGAQVRMAIKLSQAGIIPKGTFLKMDWEYFDGSLWQRLGYQSSTKSRDFDFTEPGIVSFANPSDWEQTSVNGVQNFWLRIRITNGDFGSSMRGNVNTVSEKNIAAEFLFNINQSFSNELENGQVSTALNAEFQNKKSITLSSTPKVEVITAGNQWKIIDSNQVYLVKKNGAVLDISLSPISADRKVITVNNAGYIGGELIVFVKGKEKLTGTVASTQESNKLILNNPVGGTDDLETGWTVEAPAILSGNLQPPIVSNITFAFTYLTDPFELDHCLSVNDFVFDDHTEDCRWPNRTFQPFRPVEDLQLAVRFSFDRRLPAGLVSMYVNVPQDIIEENAQGSPFVWEYRSPRGWTELGVLDETNGFRQSGMIQLIGPPDAIPAPGLGGTLFHVRARLMQGQQPESSPIGGLWINAVWAEQRSSPQEEREELGVSDGNPGQTFSVQRRPVLEGEIIEVQEWVGRGPSWRNFVLDVPEEDLRFDRDPATGQETAVWVNWRPQPHLYASQKNDRHYSVERAMGLIRFGDGHHGLIPPAGNRIIAVYSSGGSAAGNVPAGAISELRTGLPFIESVTNPIPASGGADIEAVQSVKRRGPQRLRHRDRAVSAEDCEWLAREASPDVARVRCLQITGPAGHAQRGWITLVVAPNIPDPQPQPTPEFRRRVRAHLAGRVPATVSRHVRIVGPQYVLVSVRAEIIPAEPGAAAQVETSVRDRLNQFLHPLTGGSDGRGWQFGQAVYLSQIARVIEETKGVDFARDVRLSSSNQSFGDFVEIDQYALVAAGDHELKLTIGGE